MILIEIIIISITLLIAITNEILELKVKELKRENYEIMINLREGGK